MPDATGSIGSLCECFAGETNGSGPVLLEYHADGTITETDYGPQFVRPPGQLLLTTGQVVWQYDSDFNVLSYTQIGGTSRDVCALLA